MTNSIEERITKIEERNTKVELDKKWETSKTRKSLIVLSTYMVFTIFFISAQFSDPFINAIVPTLAFTISTLSFPYFKKVWLSKQS